MLALGYTTRYSGEDAILGLAFAHTGVLYPFFAAMLGWLGVALTGSDTSSNVLFGSLQKITAHVAWLESGAHGGGEQLGRRDGKDDRRAEHLRREHGDGLCRARVADSAIRVLSQSRARRAGRLLVMLQQYVYPFTLMVVASHAERAQRVEESRPSRQRAIRPGRRRFLDYGASYLRSE